MTDTVNNFIGFKSKSWSEPLRRVLAVSTETVVEDKYLFVVCHWWNTEFILNMDNALDSVYM